jgi:indolepyruvate ferredoxin oxidoreductase beta subunit
MVFGDAASNIISEGEADILLGFEPLETLRAIGKCNTNSVVITNTSPLPPFTVAIGKGSYPEIGQTLELIRSKVSKLIAFDATAAARDAGNILSLNIVLIGALLQTGVLPLGAESVKEVIRTKTKKAFVETNLKAFELGFSAAKAA